MNAHLDLFSGIGCFSLAAEAAGWHTVAFSEIEPFPSAVLEYRWPGVPNLGDVREVRGEDVVRRFGSIDLVTGGFPCQDVSAAGKGVGIDGERSGLWREILRLVREVRPRRLLIENVPALRTRGADLILAELEAAGYAVWPLVVGAWAVGAPHRRDRVWIVGRLADASGDPLRHEPGRRGGTDGAGARFARAAHRWPARPAEPQHEWEEPRVVEQPVGLPVARSARRLARRAGRRWREQLKGLGNAIVWQVAYHVLLAMKELDHAS